MHADAIPWIERAEGDYEGTIVLAEKRSKKIAHLKAFLVDNDVRFSKTYALKSSYSLLGSS
jgi:hypothetical protein